MNFENYAETTNVDPVIGEYNRTEGDQQQSHDAVEELVSQCMVSGTFTPNQAN